MSDVLADFPSADAQLAGGVDALNAALKPQTLEWFRYLKHSEPVPEGWQVADDLRGTPHGRHARLIRKVA